MQLCAVHDRNPGRAEFCFQSHPNQLQVSPVQAAGPQYWKTTENIHSPADCVRALHGDGGGGQGGGGGGGKNQ